MAGITATGGHGSSPKHDAVMSGLGQLTLSTQMEI